MLLPKRLLPVFIVLDVIVFGLVYGREVLANWGLDTTPPTCSSTPAAGNYQAGGAITSFSVTANDPAGISTISVTGATLPAPTITTTSTSQTNTYSWTPAAGTYTLTVLATDNSGNTNPATSPCAAPTYVISPQVGAWIQVTGDIHSNDRIYAPGGP